MNEHEERFQILTADMDIPEMRRRDYRWLSRNLSIRNQDHPNFREAYKLLRHLT